MRIIQHRTLSVQLIRAPQIGSAAEFFSPSAASDGLAPQAAPPIGLAGRSRASARSGSWIRAGPERAGARRDKPVHGVTVANVTRDVIIVRQRSRLAPYPIVVHSSESAGVLAPLRGCVRA